MESRKDDIFQNLFVLELANNHWGDIDRGLRIIREHGKVVQKHGVNAAIKFQFRDTESFIHPDYLDTKVEKGDKEAVQAPGTNTRYIKKTLSTVLSEEDYKTLLDEVKKYGMVTMSSPFDEASVDMCKRLDLDVVKIGSGVAKSWTLLQKILDLGKPAIISNGGTGFADLDKVVDAFNERGIPLAINHCVSLYPSEDHELNLHQIDLMLQRYPKNIIGFSTHEYTDWYSSVMMSYAKGARTWERHIDIDADNIPVSKYCSLPHQVDEWFCAFKKAEVMCGKVAEDGRTITEKEAEYIRSVSRGVYAKRDLPKGHVITKDGLGKDFYLSIPALEGQYIERDLDDDITLAQEVKKDQPINIII